MLIKRSVKGCNVCNVYLSVLNVSSLYNLYRLALFRIPAFVGQGEEKATMGRRYSIDDFTFYIFLFTTNKN